MAEVVLISKTRKVSWLVKKNINNSDFVNNTPVMTDTKGFILGYIKRQNACGNQVYQTDIEREFHIGKSSAFELLSVMEEEGYLKRVPDPNDKRKKALILTDKSNCLMEQLKNTILNINEKALTGFSEGEKQVFIEYLDRVIANLEGEVVVNDKNN